MRPSCILILAALAGACVAQNREMPGKRLTKPPVIDGTVELEEWKEAATSAGFVDPVTSKENEFTTQVFAGYDTENLYFAFIATDPEPQLIRANEYRRQGNLEGDDRIIIVINPNASYREEQFDEFEVNPRGATLVQFAGGRAAKREWQGEWDGKGRITQSGYEVEVRVPWKILRLPGAGVRNMTINFARYVPRRQLPMYWANIGVDERIERSGMLLGVEFPKAARESVIQALPYQVVGTSEDESLIFDTGVDFRHQVGSEITALGTVNPDFRNIENAVLGIEFSRFERLADERRPFFVEGSGYFGLGGMSARLFAPQRIRQIDFGAKAFGLLPGEQSFGALFTSRFDQGNVGVVRYRKTFGAQGSLTGGYVRLDDNGITNEAFGLEGGYSGKRFGASFVANETVDSLLGKGTRQDYDVYFQDGVFSVFTGWQRISSDFVPRAGFAPRVGFYGPYAMMSYDRNFRTGGISNIDFSVGFDDTKRDDGLGVFQRGYSVGLDIAYHNGLEHGMSYSDYNFEGALDKIFSFDIAYPHTDPFRNVGMDVSFGTIDGEKYRDIEFGARYKFPNTLSVSAGLQFVETGKESEFQHILGFSYELSEFRSVSGRAIFAPDGVNWYLAYRQSGNIGTEYYLIIGDPNADSFQRRIVLKLVTPFNLRL